MAKQKQYGLGGRPQLNALGRFRIAVMPDMKSKSLSEILEEMPDKERNRIESYAKMILRMTTPYAGSYYQQAKRRYPKIGRAKHVLLAELLQAIQPRENKDGPDEEDARRSKERLAMSETMLKMDFGQTEDDNALDFSRRVTQEAPKGNYKQYAAKIDKEGVFETRQEFVDVLKPIALEVAEELGIEQARDGLEDEP